MADGNLVRQQGNSKGAMVFGPSVYDVPLLPYEKELIKTIGITEEEYQLFAAEVRRRGRLRPAEYEHVPDIQAGPTLTPVLISLAISLVLTGVSYLLTPKPKMPSAQKRGSSIDTGSITGASRFNPSRGFETLNELADYASPIPIIFGLYQGQNRGEHGGGIFVTPKLVWSRMFSYGTQQAALLMFVVGEQGVENGDYDGIQKPDLDGIFLGNNALDPIHKDLFAFYWKSATTTGSAEGIPQGPRIRSGDLKYGTQGKADSGNPNIKIKKSKGGAEDILLVPTNDEESSTSFCHAYSPVNSSEFGAYAPIANGNGIKVNYQVITIGENKEDEGKDATETGSSQRAKVMQRVRIVGDENKAREFEDGGPGKMRKAYENNAFLKNDVRKQNQSGTGRQYSPRMGIISVNGVKPDSGDKSRQVIVNENDIAKFKISDTEIKKNIYKVGRAAVSVDDINSLVRESQISADEQMQKGEIFAIANTLWEVTDRSIPGSFGITKGSQTITLKCIDTSLSVDKKIGIVSEKLVVEPSVYIDDRKGIGPQYYPLTKMSVASFKNNRPAVVTEIGIKSTVFQRLNGLTAINGLPTPNEIEDYGKNNVSVTTGTANINISRASAFRIAVRKAGTISEFFFLNEYFVVLGSKPVAQYNYIQVRAQFTGEPVELEFKIIPIAGSQIRTVDNNRNFVVLTAKADAEDIYSTPDPGFTTVPNIGNINVRCAGFERTKSYFQENIELGRGATIENTGSGALKPSAIDITKYIPQDKLVKDEFAAQKIRRVDSPRRWVSTPTTKYGRADALAFALAGNADDANSPKEKTTETTEYYNNQTEYIKLRWKWRKEPLGNNNYGKTQNGQKKNYVFVSCEVISSTKGFPLSHEFEVRRGKGKTGNISRPTDADYGERNPFKNNNPDINSGVLQGSGVRFKVTEATLISGGDQEQAYLYEKLGSAADLEVGDPKVIAIEKTQAAKQIRLRLKAKVIRLPDGHVSGEKKGWRIVSVVPKPDDTTAGWQFGDTVRESQTVSVANPFGIRLAQVGADYAITALRGDVVETEYGGENFEFNNGHADLSFYRQLIQKSNESEPEHEVVYVNEILLNNATPKYSNLTTAALCLKASRAFSNLDQMRCWLASGLKVKRLHPNYANDTNNPYEDSGSDTFKKQYGPSHLFTDLVYYLLTDQMAGAGGLLNMSDRSGDNRLIDIESFQSASRFLSTQNLFFNGVITERTNIRQFVTELAPYFLCNFVITDGKFGLVPVVPFFERSGNIKDGSVTISQFFTSGNILEDTFSLEYLRAEDRRPFVAVARYRSENPNKLPEEKSVTVYKKGAKNVAGLENLPHENFDLTQFCTSKEHAEKVARYFLAVRELVTHTIKFSTTVFGLDLKAGSFIKVITEASPYSSANNGTIDGSGNVASVSPLDEGQYNVVYYTSGSENDVEEGIMEVCSGRVTDATFHNSVFTLDNREVSENVYVVEQLTFSQEGTVDIVASEHPCTNEPAELTSLLALAIDDESGSYVVVES